MISVGGGLFHVAKDLHFPDAKGKRTLIAMKILSEVAVVLRREDCRITQPKRSKGEDVKAQCILGEQFGIDLFVSPQEVEGDGSAFELVGFGFVSRDDDTPAAEVAVANAWRKIQAASSQVVKTLCSTHITWLSVEDLDARASRRARGREGRPDRPDDG